MQNQLELLSQWYELWMNNGFGPGTPDKLPNSLHTATVVALIEAKLGCMVNAWRLRMEDERGRVETSPEFYSRLDAREWLESSADDEYVASIMEWLTHPWRWSVTVVNGGHQEKWTVVAA